MRTNYTIIALVSVLAAPVAAQTQRPSFVSVSQLQAAHDRALIRDLKTYVEEHPKADDLDQAYLALFNKAIEHDWFVEHETLGLKQIPIGSGASQFAPAANLLVESGERKQRA